MPLVYCLKPSCNPKLLRDLVHAMWNYDVRVSSGYVKPRTLYDVRYLIYCEDCL